MRIAKELRQQIVTEFAERNGGVYDPAAFLAEVSSVGSDHPAWKWFQWDNELAAQEHRLWQAREFVQGLRVKFEVRVLERGAIKVVTKEVPLVISPISGRRNGGGYVLTDPDDPVHMMELCRQAAHHLHQFVERYQSVLAFAHVPIEGLEQIVQQIGCASSVSQPEAAE